jgi:hypothetical protein
MPCQPARTFPEPGAYAPGAYEPPARTFPEPGAYAPCLF